MKWMRGFRSLSSRQHRSYILGIYLSDYRACGNAKKETEPTTLAAEVWQIYSQDYKNHGGRK